MSTLSKKNITKVDSFMRSKCSSHIQVLLAIVSTLGVFVHNLTFDTVMCVMWASGWTKSPIDLKSIIDDRSTFEKRATDRAHPSMVQIAYR